MIDDHAADVTLARTLLRHEQRRWANGVIRDPSAQSPRQQAEARAELRRAEARRDGDDVYESVFKYDYATESRRWDRTLEVIRRVDPGPDEDGGYLEFLARQAASCELTILSMGLLDDPSVLDGILLGTSGEPRSEAYTSSTKGSRSALICLSAGMVYLMYQAAKAVVLSWKVKQEPGAGASFSSLLEDTVALLDADARPVTQLTDTLANWFTLGVARPLDSTAPEAHYHPPLALLTNFAERFVIAHEYGHALYDQIGVTPPPWLPPAVPNSVLKELRADVFATVVLCAGASELDRMAPNMVLQGAMLAIKIHEIADDAIGIMAGAVPDYTSPAATHPPFEVRAEFVRKTYVDMLDDKTDDRLSPEAFEIPIRTADELWRRGRPHIERLRDSGRPLAPIWTGG